MRKMNLGIGSGPVVHASEELALETAAFGLAPVPVLRYPDLLPANASDAAARGSGGSIWKTSKADEAFCRAASVTVALLQSLCTAVLTINGIRVGIGLAALAAGSICAPVLAFHRDAIRIPMLTVAVLGAVVNLAVLAWIWHLRTRPEAQWRRREIAEEAAPFRAAASGLAILTLVLVGLEVWTHPIVHRKHQSRTRRSAQEVRSQLAALHAPMLSGSCLRRLRSEASSSLSSRACSRSLNPAGSSKTRSSATSTTTLRVESRTAEQISQVSRWSSISARRAASTSPSM